MAEQNCRLCYEKKPKSIGIFTVKGVKLNMADTIRMHFPDEVREVDHMPKLVCADCWTKVSDFHSFYEAVEEAKTIYFKSSVKEEAPVFIETDCDSIGFDDTTASVKVESSIEGSVDNFEHTEHDRLEDDDEFDSTASNNDGNSTNDKHLTKFDEKNDEIAVQVIDISAKPSAPNKKKMEHLISEYMEMHCEICQHPFATLSGASYHYTSKHQRKAVTLKCCQRQIPLSNIREHILYHLRPELFKCKTCGRAFTLRRALKHHEAIHLPKQYECDICHKKYCNKSYISKHMQSAHVSSDQSHECEICQKSFATKQRLRHHVKCVHKRSYQSICHVCAKVYNSVSSLALHLREHSEIERPRSICNLCGKSYKDERILQKHVERSHNSNPLQLQCLHCPKTSPNRNALAAHIRRFHLYTVQKCHLCDKEFKRPLALKEHLATHTGEHLYNCAYCPKMFRHNGNMFAHYNKCHKLQWDADKKCNN